MEWKLLFDEKALNDGRNYVRNGSVHNMEVKGENLTAEIVDERKFRVRINISGFIATDLKCSCPLPNNEVKCKHMAAALWAWEMKEDGYDLQDFLPRHREVASLPKEITPPKLLGETDEEPISDAESISNDSLFMNHDEGIELSADINNLFSYSLFLNDVSLIRSVTIKNTSDKDISDLSIRIWTDMNLIEPISEKVELLTAGEEHIFKKFKVIVHGDLLASFTERLTCVLYVAVTRGQEEYTRYCEELTVLAFDQWPGFPAYRPDLLVAFVTPNHPVIDMLLQSVVKYMEKWTQDPTLQGYQVEDRNRVLTMAAAAYAAIQEKNITYSNPPASYEGNGKGQRIRLADQMMESHLGTCMDMTLLYVGCLEAMGLNPILIMTEGHIFAGVWLIDDSFPDPWTDDPTQLEKRLADGVNELVVVECTCMCAGESRTFDEARAIAEDTISRYDEFEFSVDVARARGSKVRPLPARVKSDGGYIVEHKERTEDEVTSAPTGIEVIDLEDLKGQKQIVTKQTQWERKLLDLSMRNMLLNMRVTGSVIPILTADLGSIEDALSEGAEYEVIERPAEWDIHKIDSTTLEKVNELGPYENLIALDAKHHKLHSWLGEKELSKLMTKMYRTAITSMEENGASTLYMTLGVLRWFEGIKEQKLHFAPIILIPIDIIRKSANKGFVIRERDDEAQVNITLLEFLKQNFQIEIPGLVPPPKDDHGLDVEKIFTIIRHGIMGKKMWNVIEEAFIGNFSFSQFVMWNDMRNHADLLERNKIVHALMNGAIDWDCTIPEEAMNDDAYLPVSVDASQLRAVNMAANDVSFVLHGPPGTGKSQTITAMIANALTKGKTVLFVAEKMAALEVVQKRLASLGIGDFCLELHSNKAVKKTVLEQLKRGIDLRVLGFRTEYEKKIDDIHKMREELDNYVKKLHATRKCGMSIRELIDIYETIPEMTQKYRPSREFIESVTKEQLDTNLKTLERLIDAGRQIGHPKGHALSIVGQTEYSQSFRRQLEDAIYDYEKTINELIGIGEEFANDTAMAAPVSKSQWQNIFDLAECVIQGENLPAFLMQENGLGNTIFAATQYLKLRDQYIQCRNVIVTKYNMDILGADLNSYYQRYASAGKKLFGKAKAIEEVTSDLQKYAKVQVSQEMLDTMIVEVEQYKVIEKNYNMTKASTPDHVMDYIDDTTTIDQINSLKAQWEQQLQVVRKYMNKLAELKANGMYSKCVEKAEAIGSAKVKFYEKEKLFMDLLKISLNDNSDNWMESKKNLIQLIDSNSESLRDWITYNQIRSECKEMGLSDICELYEQGLEHDKVVPLYRKAVYRALIWNTIEKEPVLDNFIGNSFNEHIKEYNRMEQELLKLTKQEMYYRLTHNLPTGHDDQVVNAELAILRKAISSGGRGHSIRSLFEQIPHILPKLCPCLLMSPISVAQYLKADAEPYDIVIFDEASQLPTCKAVGVLARGKNAVIVGDPNQMPPTSFFAGNMIDEDNLDIEDLDSILDDCLALGIPSAHLQWHYRSRHESLIAFSNQEYYENSMLTFPSVNDREKRVKLCTVNGVFNRKKGRVNEEEGRAVVKEILRRYNDEDLKEQSIGIVTFNISQQGLIEDLLTEEYRNDLEFDKWANEREEKLFVKNLENVQGDERDVILFSIGFGPDDEGKLSLNFGPLNKEGGWKRLNVAVSRARKEMIVFSSMLPEMIDLNRTKSKGVEGLRAFLEFADNGKLSDGSFEAAGRAKGITRMICEAIENAGYKVQREVGHSDFKVDIAVVNPYDQDEYLMGILLDGNSYKKSTNTKDREVSQISVLQGLGWTIHRIWTMDWWDNKEKEISNVLGILEELKEKAKAAAENKKAKDEGPESEEITYQKPEKKGPSEKKEKKQNYGNDDFDAHERFAPLIPQQESQDEPLEDEKIEEVEKIAKNPVVETTTIEYSLETFEPAVVTSEAELSLNDFSKKQGKEILNPIMEKIIETEAPVAVNRLISKTLRAVHIQRSSVQLEDALDKLIKRLPYYVNKQNGMRYVWKNEQQMQEYSCYRVDAACEDKRDMNDISQQELKNAICITLKNKGKLNKDTLIKETARTMGFARTGKNIVEAVERGVKYGKKTGEIIVTDDHKFMVGKS